MDVRIVSSESVFLSSNTLIDSVIANDAKIQHAKKILRNDFLGTTTITNILNEFASSLCDGTPNNYRSLADLLLLHFNFYVVGGTLISALDNFDSLPNDYDILMCPSGSSKSLDVLLGVVSMGSSLIKQKSAYSKKDFLVYNSSIKIRGISVQLLLTMKMRNVNDIINEYDMCHCRIAYDIFNNSVIAKYPNLYCTLNKKIATNWEPCDTNLIEFFCRIKTAKLNERSIKYKNRSNYVRITTNIQNGDRVSYKGDEYRVIHIHAKETAMSATGAGERNIRGMINIQRLGSHELWPSTVHPDEVTLIGR